MISKEKNLYLWLYLLNAISQSNGLVEFQKTDFTKILQSFDAVSSDTHLFDVTLKLLQSVCACMHKTLHKDHKIFINEANTFNLDEETDQENDLDLYKQIYNSTCIHLRHELVNKFRRHKLADDIDDINQEVNDAVTKYENNNIDENMKAVMRRTIFASLIKKQDNRIYKIEKHNLFANKLLIGNNNEIRVIIIITLYPFSNKTVDKLKQKEVTEKEINETLLKDTPIDIDIINAVNLADNKKNFKAVIAKKCDLYSIYLFILQSLKRNSIKTFRFLRRKGTIKIYIDTNANQNAKDFPNPCCENNTLITECRKRIFEAHEYAEKIAQNKTDVNELETYKDIVSKIKILIKQYNKKNNNQRLIRSSKILLVTNPIIHYGYETVNKSNSTLAFTPPEYQSINTSIKTSHRAELIDPTHIMTKPSHEYILSNKSSRFSGINNSYTITNEASSNIITTLVSGVTLGQVLKNDEPTQIYRNTISMEDRNLIIYSELVKKQPIVLQDAKTELTSPISLVFDSKWPEQSSNRVTKTLSNPLKIINFYKQPQITKSMTITPQYIAETSVLKIFFPQLKVNAPSTKSLNNCTEESKAKDKNNSSFAFTTDAYNNQQFFKILQNTSKKSKIFSSKKNQVISPQNHTSPINVFQNPKVTTNSPRSFLRSSDNNINLFFSSLHHDYVKFSTEATKTNILLQNKSTFFDFQMHTQSYRLNETKYLQEKRNNLQSILENLHQNNKKYVSNTNKRIVDISSKIENKPDTSAYSNKNVAYIKKVDEHKISEQNKSYQRRSPLYFIINQGKQRSTPNYNKTSTSVNVSNPTNVKKYESLPYQAVKNLETHLSPLKMLENNTIYGQVTLPQLKILKLNAVLEEKQNIKQKYLHKLPFYKSISINDYDNFITDSVSEAYLTSNTTLKVETPNRKDNIVKNFKMKFDLFTYLSNNNKASLENAAFTKDIDIHSNSLSNYVWSPQSPNKLDADLTNEGTHKSTLMNLVPDLRSLLGRNINNNVTTTHTDSDNNVTLEKYPLHYSIPTGRVNKYIRNKYKKRQNFETYISNWSDVKYFSKYNEKKIQRSPMFKEKINGGIKKFKLDGLKLPENKNSKNTGNDIGSQNFEPTANIKEITVAGTYSKDFINQNDMLSTQRLLPSLLITKMGPQSTTKINTKHNFSVLNEEENSKHKENETFSLMKEIMLEKLSTGDTKNKNNKFLDPVPQESEDRLKAYNYFKQKNTGKPFSKDISVKYDYLKDVTNIYKTKLPIQTTDIFFRKVSQNKQIRKYDNYENKGMDRNKLTFYLNKSDHKNKSNITNTVPITTPRVVIKLITNNKMTVPENTIPKPLTLLKINLSSNPFTDNNELFTINEVTYAPIIKKTKLFDPIMPPLLHMTQIAKRSTQYLKFSTSKLSTPITIKNISYKEINQEVKRETATKQEGRSKKSTLVPTLSHNTEMTQSLDNNIIILGIENTNELTNFDATKENIFRNQKVTDEKNIQPEVFLNNIYDGLQLKEQYQYGSKKDNVTEKKKVSQSVKNMTYLSSLIKDYQNLTKNDPYVTTLFKKFTTHSTKTDLEENIYNTSSMNPQTNIVFAETELTNNFTKQTEINNLKMLTSRYNNTNFYASNNSGITIKNINVKSEKRLMDISIKTYNETTTLHKLHNELPLMNHTLSYTSDFLNSDADQNVFTIKAVNSITAGIQKYTNLKPYKENETLEKPYLNIKDLSMLFVQTISPPIKDSTQRITDYKSIISTETYQVVKNVNKTMKKTSSSHSLQKKYQNYMIKNGLNVSESYVKEKTMKSENPKVYITSPAYAMQNNTKFILETYLNNELKSQPILITPKIYTKSEKKQKNKSESVVQKYNTLYNTNERRITKIYTTEKQHQIQNIQSTIPISSNTDTNKTYPHLDNYSQYRSDSSNMKIIHMPKDLSANVNKNHKTSVTVYNDTYIPNIELKWHAWNGNTSTLLKVMSNSIGRITENEVTKQKMQNIRKGKQQFQDKKTFLHTEDSSLLQSTTKSYSGKPFSTYRRLHLNENLSNSEYPFLKFRVTQSSETDLSYNNISGNDFSETKNKNKNQINNNVFQNLTSDKNKTYDLVTFSVQRKYASDVEDINFNHSTVLKSTSEKNIRSEIIIDENMTKKKSSEKYKKNWDVTIIKPLDINNPQILSSNRKKDKKNEFIKSAINTDTSLKTLDVNNNIKYTTLEMSHENGTISSFVSHLNSYTSKYFPSSQQTAMESHFKETSSFDRQSKMMGQIYYTTMSPITKIIPQFATFKMNTTIRPVFEDSGRITRSTFIFRYENTTNVTKNFYKKYNEKEHLYITNGVLDQTDKSFFSKDSNASTSASDIRKLQKQELNKKIFLSNKRNKIVLQPINIKANVNKSTIPVTNKTALHSNILKNISDFDKGNGSRASLNLKIQINNNFKIKTLTFQKVYLKNNYKLHTTLRRFKKSKTIKYNTYQQTDRNLDITQSMANKINLNEGDKQTNIPKYSSLYTRISNFPIESSIPTKSILDTQLKVHKKSVATNRSNGHRAKSKVLNKKLANVNKKNIIYPFENPIFYPVKKLPSNKQRKIMRRIYVPNKGREIVAIDTKDFFQRRATPNNNYFRKQIISYSKNQIEKPLTFKPEQYIISPMFDQIYDLKNTHFRPKPLLIGNNDFYRKELQTHHRSNSLFLPQKHNYLRESLSAGNSKVSHIIKRPVYLPPNTKPKFLRDRIDSIRNYLKNADFIKSTEFPTKNYIEATTDVEGVPLVDPLYYFRKSGWYEREINDNFATSTLAPKKTPRKRISIFFLSPSVPYRYF